MPNWREMRAVIGEMLWAAVFLALVGALLACGLLGRRASGQEIMPKPAPTLASFFVRAPAKPPALAVPVPPDNKITRPKIVLGAMLYADGALAADGLTSCIKCHEPKFDWADNRSRSIGIDGQRGDRHAPTIRGAAFIPNQFWDGSARGLEGQCLQPLVNPKEMGNGSQQQVANRLSDMGRYRRAFQAAFGDDDVTVTRLAKAMATFERIILPGSAPIDRYLAGDKHAMSDEAIRGWDLFRGKARCTQCHPAPQFSDFAFHVTGWASNDDDFGRGDRTQQDADDRAFKTPSLRNVARTPPYMHDGSCRNLSTAIDHFNRGGNFAAGRNTGRRDLRDARLRKLGLTADEKADLRQFLVEGLTSDQQVNPYREPWLQAELKKYGFPLTKRMVGQ